MIRTLINSKSLLILALTTISISVAISGCAFGIPKSDSHPRLGKSAQNPFPNKNNDAYLNNKSLNKCTMILFWSSHCLTCKRYLAHLDRLNRKNAASNINVAGVIVFSDKEEAKKQISQYQVQIIQIEDEIGELFLGFDLKSIPSIIVLDRMNRLVYVLENNITLDKLEKVFWHYQSVCEIDNKVENYNKDGFINALTFSGGFLNAGAGAGYYRGVG